MGPPGNEYGLLELPFSGTPVTVNGSSNLKVDIVAVHGVNGHRVKTWTRQDTGTAESEPPEMWLSEVLHTSVPNARVMTYGYFADPAAGRFFEELALRHDARELLRQLQKKRKDCENTPLVFVGHNLGGVLIKELLWVANHEKDYLRIAANTKLLIFFGAPHCPEDHDVWLDLVFGITLASTEAEPFISSRRKMLRKVLEQGPSALIAASSRFQRFARQYRSLSVFETQMTPFVGKVVPEEWAGDPDEGTKHLHRDRDHTRICQFSKDDGDPQLLQELCREINVFAEASEHSNWQDFSQDYLQCRLSLTTLHPDGFSPVPTGKPYAGTLTWAPRLLDNPAAFVHVHGRAGCGKSVLASHLAELSRKTDARTLVFHFDAHDDRRRTAKDLLLSFLCQLMFQEETIIKSYYVVTMYGEIRDSSNPSLHTLWNLFRGILGDLGDTKVVCIIDAIEQCDAVSSALLLSHIATLDEQIKTSYKFIVTGRTGENTASTWQRFSGFQLDMDTDDDVTTDEKYFVRQRLQGSEFNDVADDLEATNSTFLVLDLVFTVLLEVPGSNELSLAASRVAMSIRTSSDQVSHRRLYDHLLSDIPAPDREWCYQVFSWLVFAARPMTVEQLAVATIVDANAATTLSPAQIEKQIRHNMSEDLKRTLGRLVRIENGEVHLHHQTFREFLTEHTFDTFCSFGDAALWHASLAATCIRYISANDLWDETDALKSYIQVPPQLRFPHSQSLPPSHRFATYAAQHWATHVRHASATGDQSLDEQVIGFLKDETARNRWAQLYWAIKLPPSLPSSKDVEVIPDWNSPLQIAAHLGLFTVVKQLLRSENEEVGAETEDAIAEAGDANAEAGDASTEIDDFGHALNLAAGEGHVSTVNVLIQHCGRDIKHVTKALKMACEMGHFSVVEHLLSMHADSDDAEHGLDLSDCLPTCAKLGYSRIVARLISAGADVNAPGTEADRSPLSHAASNGHDVVVAQFLAADVDVAATEVDATDADLNGRTALHLAAEFGHLAVVKQLL
ncbi:hypothetical protein BZA05DRAFT_267123, partial [Tricharina praecox]|uniref:uncharacterized protein n=1 Tax=Tricharina praecox TaxID=43433 RepID=UPI00221F411A